MVIPSFFGVKKFREKKLRSINFDINKPNLKLGLSYKIF